MRSMARADAHTIFAEGYIAAVMQSVLDAPVLTGECEQASRVGELAGQAGHAIACLVRGLASGPFDGMVFEFEDLSQLGPVAIPLQHAVTVMRRCSIRPCPLSRVWAVLKSVGGQPQPGVTG